MTQGYPRRPRGTPPAIPLRAGLFWGLAVAAAAGVWAQTQSAPSRQPSVAAGERMYRQGVLPAGQTATAVVQGDVQLTGFQAACAGCHRRSGFGSSESNTTVPPVVGALLYKPVERVSIASAHKRSEGAGTRPAYTDETLARAIRHGVDPSGRAFDPMMPRFDLTDDEVTSLIAYLKTLSPGPDPGVTNTTVHLATVVTEGVDPLKRKAMLDVLTTFVQTKNALTRNEVNRRTYARRSGMPEQAAYRTWDLHLWELTGGPGSWRAQLEAYYSAQPVFALISGFAAGSWEPIHQFCEAASVPCLFPNADIASVSEGDFYSFYFSRGPAVEAEAVAAWLRDAGGARGQRVVQVFRANAQGQCAALALRRAFGAETAVVLADRAVENGAPITAAFWRELVERDRPDVLVLWLGEGDLAALRTSDGLFSGVDSLVLSATMAPDGTRSLPTRLRSKILLTYPYDLPEPLDRRLNRVRVWLKAHKIEITDQRLQANTLFAATIAGDALSELLNTFVRDLFVETIEHMVDSAIPISAYPRLTLGPGERFAAKGCYLVRLAAVPDGSVTPVTDWIVR